MRTIALTRPVPAPPTKTAILSAATSAVNLARAADEAYIAAKRNGNPAAIQEARSAYLKKADGALMALLNLINMAKTQNLTKTESQARYVHTQLNERRKRVEAAGKN